MFILILGFEQNVLSEEEIDHIWKPNVGYTNAKLGTRHVEILGLMVRRESDALPFDFSSDVEGKKYLKIYSNNFKHFTRFLSKYVFYVSKLITLFQTKSILDNRIL